MARLIYQVRKLRNWKLQTGWKRWLLVAGAMHASFTFTDLALLAERSGRIGAPG